MNYFCLNASTTFLLATVLGAVLWFCSFQNNLWNGYYIVIGWAILQLGLVEIVYRYFQYNYRDTDILDVVLAVIIGFVICVVTASLGLDLVSENASSNIFIAKSIFSNDICSQVISIAESHASEHGWLTKRHKNYPTTDLAVHTIQQNISLPSSNGASHKVDFSLWVNETIESEIFPRLMSYYVLSDVRMLSMQDLFIVKYDGVTPGAQRHLQMHMDSSLLSFNIALSDHRTGISGGGSSSTSFEGGGTHFSLSDDVIQLERGAMLSHPSRIYHEGVAVTGGVRYILVGFVRVEQWRWSTVWRRFGAFTKCLSVYEEQQQQQRQRGSSAFSLDGYALTSSVCQPWLYTYYFSVSSLVSDIVNSSSNTGESLMMKGLLFLIVVSVAMLGVLCGSLCCGAGRDAADGNEDFDESKYEVVFSGRSSSNSNNTSSGTGGSIIGFYNAKVSSKEV